MPVPVLVSKTAPCPPIDNHGSGRKPNVPVKRVSSQIEIRAVVHDRIGSQAEEILLGEVPLRRGEVGKDVFVRHTGEAELQLIFLVGFERGLTGDTQIQVPADLGPAVFDTQCKTGNRSRSRRASDGIPYSLPRVVA